MKSDEIKASIFVALKNRGFNVEMNKSIYLPSKVRGYQRVVLDLVFLTQSGDIQAVFYTGKRKDRKLIKHRMAKRKLFEVNTEQDINRTLIEFQEWVITNFKV